MFKQFIDPNTKVGSFLDTLYPVDQMPIAEDAPSRLGRTAHELQRLREDAKREGSEEGYLAGLELGKLEAQRLFESEVQEQVLLFGERLREIEERIDAATARFYEQAEHDIAPLAVAIAARILGREIALGEDVIQHLAKDAIQEITHAASVRIRLNPFDLPELENFREDLLGLAPSLRKIEIIPDNAISGGCIMETEGGVIDATIGSMLRLAIASIRKPFSTTDMTAPSVPPVINTDETEGE